VASIIGATNNGIGTSGVTDGRSICWVVARVFASTTSAAYLSDIIDGVTWAFEVERADIVNLSLGGSVTSDAGRSLYQRLFNSGALAIASSGNGGNRELIYPASYSTVVSVAAVDSHTPGMPKADFSNFNTMVDLTAPGVDIFGATASSESKSVVFVKVQAGESTVSVPGNQIRRAGSVDSDSPISGAFVECQINGFCPGAPDGFVCFMKR